MSKPPLSQVPLLFPAALFGAGILTARLLPSLLWPLTAAIMVLCAVALLRKSTITLALSIIFLTGYLLYHAEAPATRPLGDEPVELWVEGEIVSASEISKGQSLLLKVTRLGSTRHTLEHVKPMKISLLVTDFTPEFIPLQTIAAKLRLSPINPVIDLPDEVAPQQRLIDRGIYYSSVAPEEAIEVVSEPHGPLAWAQECNRATLHHLFRSGLSAPTKQFLAATLLGNDHYLLPEVRQSFARAGLAHVLALSGLHVGIIIMIISCALFPFYLTCRRTPALIITILLLWTYAFATGLPPSVVRAVTMVTVYSGALILQRRPNAYNSLLFAAMAILLFNPEALFEIGFQLSFAAVLAIVAFAEPMNPVSPRRRLLYNIMAYPCVTIAAMLGTALISIFYFHSFPAMFLLANILVAPLLPLLLGGGVVVIILQCAGMDWELLCLCIDSMYRLLQFISDSVCSFSGSYGADIYIPGWLFIPYVAALLAFWRFLTKRSAGNRHLAVDMLCIFIICIVAIPDKVIENRLYIARRTAYTAVVEPTPEALVIYTSAKPSTFAEIAEDARARYGEYMYRRNIDSLAVKPMPMRLGKLNILMADSLLHSQPTHCEYLLIDKNIRLSVEDLLSKTQIDTLLLSPDFDKRKTRKYLSLAAEAGIPCRAISAEGFAVEL